MDMPSIKGDDLQEATQKDILFQQRIQEDILSTVTSFVFHGMEAFMHSVTSVPSKKAFSMAGNTVQYKIFLSKNFGDFGKLQVIQQNLLVQKFLL